MLLIGSMITRLTSLFSHEAKYVWFLSTSLIEIVVLTIGIFYGSGVGTLSRITNHNSSLLLVLQPSGNSVKVSLHSLSICFYWPTGSSSGEIMHGRTHCTTD